MPVTSRESPADRLIMVIDDDGPCAQNLKDLIEFMDVPVSLLLSTKLAVALTVCDGNGENKGIGAAPAAGECLFLRRRSSDEFKAIAAGSFCLVQRTVSSIDE